MTTAQGIRGAEKLLSHFGCWPSFHDAEVVWLRLDRPTGGKEGGAGLEASVHAFRMTDRTGPDGFLVLEGHVLVQLRFRGIVDLRLEGFNEQNALLGLSIVDIRDRGMEDIRFEVGMDPAYGLSVSFQCREVEVVDVLPCLPDGTPVLG